MLIVPLQILLPVLWNSSSKRRLGVGFEPPDYEAAVPCQHESVGIVVPHYGNICGFSHGTGTRRDKISQEVFIFLKTNYTKKRKLLAIYTNSMGIVVPHYENVSGFSHGTGYGRDKISQEVFDF